jgi:hypothetical protein
MVVWAAIVLWAAVDADAEGRAAQKRGVELATQLRYKDALAAFDEALSHFQRAQPALSDRPLVFFTWIEIASAWIEQKREDRAEAAFSRAVMFDAELVPSTTMYPPDIVERFHKAKKTLLSRPPATLSITSRPEGALVLIDAKPVCSTPCSPKVIAGEHWIALQADGHATFTSVVTASAGKVERADVFLTSTEAPITIVVPPAPDGKASVSDPAAAPVAATAAAPVYRRAWFWGVIGGLVVAGAAVGLGLGLGLRDARPGGIDLVVEGGR